MASLKRFWVLAPFILSLAFASAQSLAGELTDAVKARDVARVQSLLAAGANVNEKVRGTTDPLHRGDYPLNIAAVFGPAQMVTLLLEAGANLEQPGRDGLHPLHNAAKSGHRDIVALLIQRGAEVDAKDAQGHSPLNSFAASAGGDIEIARMLLAAGADPNIEEDMELLTPLSYAAASGNVELGRLLIAAHVDVNHRDSSGGSPLHIAAISRRQEFVKLLIGAGADLTLKSKAGFTPLGYVSDAVIRQLLIEAGAK